MATTASRPRRFSERVDRDIPSLGGRQRSWTAGGKTDTSSTLNGLVRLIEICHEGEESSSHILTEPTTTLGRDESCTVRIDAQSVSRSHCKIQYDENGQVWLFALSDTNATYLNGEKVVESRRPLENGDIIEMGRKFFRFDNGKSDNKPLTPKHFSSPQLKQRINSVPLPRTCSMDEKPTRPRTPQPKTPSSRTISSDEIRVLCHRRGHSLPNNDPRWRELDALPDALPKKNSIDLVSAEQEMLIASCASPDQDADDEEEEEEAIVEVEINVSGLEAIRSVSSPIGTDLLARKVARAMQRSAVEEACAAASGQSTPVVVPSADGGGSSDVAAAGWVVSELRRELRPPPTAEEVEAAKQSKEKAGGERMRPWEEEEREGETAGDEYLRIAGMTVAQGREYMREKFVLRMTKRSLYNRMVHSPSMGVTAEELMVNQAMHALAGTTQDSLAIAAEQLFNTDATDSVDGASAARFPESVMCLAPIASGEGELNSEALLPAMVCHGGEEQGALASSLKPLRFRDARMEARRLYNQSVYSPSMGGTEEEMLRARDAAGQCKPQCLDSLAVDVDVQSAEDEEDEEEEEEVQGSIGRELHNQAVHSPSMGMSEEELVVERILHHAQSEAAALAERDAEGRDVEDEEGEEEGGGSIAVGVFASPPLVERHAMDARMLYNKAVVYSPSFGVSRDEWARRFEREEAAAKLEGDAGHLDSIEDCSDCAISVSDEYATIASASATPPESMQEERTLEEEEGPAAIVGGVETEEAAVTPAVEDIGGAVEQGGGWWWPLRMLLWRTRRVE